MQTLILLLALAAPTKEEIASDLDAVRAKVEALPSISDKTPALASIDDAKALVSEIKTDRLLRAEDFTYVGAFRVPYSNTMKTFNFLGNAPCLTSDGALVLTGWKDVNSRPFMQIKMSIPKPGLGPLSTLPIATLLAGPTDLSNGLSQANLGGNSGYSGTYYGGMIQVGDEFLATMYGYYDANGGARLSHGFFSANFTAPSSRGWYALAPDNKTGHVAGYLGKVPDAWRDRIGSPYYSGLCGVPIVSRQSYGPAFIGFDPTTLKSGVPAPANYLLDYPGDHPYKEWALYKNQSPDWNMTSSASGTAFIDRNGKSAVTFSGRTGIGKIWYGLPEEDFSNFTPTSTTSPSLNECNAHPEYLATMRGLGHCLDPLIKSKGTHSEGRKYCRWMYDPQDLVDVKNGLKPFYSLRPYAILTLPIPYGNEILGGEAYDEANGLLYISQTLTEARTTYSRLPVIHVFRVAD